MSAINYSAYVNVVSGSLFDAVMKDCGQKLVHKNNGVSVYAIDEMMARMVAVEEGTNNLIAFFTDESDCSLFCIEYNKKYS